MAIRDRFRRALCKSDSSDDDSASQTDSNTTSSSLRKTTTTTSTLSRVFTFGSRDKDGDRERARAPDKEKKNSRGRGRSRSRSSKKPIHPSQRPLTLQNLRHQEMLSQFTMTFGASDPSQIESPSFCGVSPCCTRPASVDLDRDKSSGPPSESAAESPRSQQ